jgi:oxidase EvaA
MELNKNLKEEIKKLIEANHLTDNKAQKLLNYCDLVLSDENQFHTTEELVKWIEDIRLRSRIEIHEKNVNQLRSWNVDPTTGEISHSSGEFFKIIGISVTNSQREVTGWDQPMIFQKEMGVLGIIRTSISGTYHYLLNAKFEPGNTLFFQISPTLQATYSNLKKAHGGRRPKFCEFFLEETAAKVVYRQWLAEDGGRFYGKSNLNMLVEVDLSLLGEIPYDFKWFTLSQIKEFLLHDNYINPHVRSILCHL